MTVGVFNDEPPNTKRVAHRNLKIRIEMAKIDVSRRLSIPLCALSQKAADALVHPIDRAFDLVAR